jgi:hypothetical protein
MLRGSRVLLLAIYLLQTAVLMPLHEQVEIALPAAEPGLALRATCAGSGQCPDPDHHHHSGDPHRAGDCASCAAAGRPALAARAATFAAATDIVLLLAPIASTPAGVPFIAHRSPRGPPAALSA